jgi:hypothetical protein
LPLGSFWYDITDASASIDAADSAAATRHVRAVRVEERLRVALRRTKARVERKERVDVLLERASRCLADLGRDVRQRAHVVVDDRLAREPEDLALALGRDRTLRAIGDRGVLVLAVLRDHVAATGSAGVVAVARAEVRDLIGTAERSQVVGSVTYAPHSTLPSTFSSQDREVARDW